jgi:DNA polymerase-1
MLDQYQEVVLVDFEFNQPDGERVKEAVCVVVHLLKSGKTLRLWQDQFGPAPPYSTGPDTLFVSYNAVAEVGCHLALGWPVPQRVLDLYPEFLARINAFRPKGTKPPTASLLSALERFGLDSIGATEKRGYDRPNPARRPVVRGRAHGDP